MKTQQLVLLSITVLSQYFNKMLLCEIIIKHNKRLHIEQGL